MSPPAVRLRTNRRNRHVWPVVLATAVWSVLAGPALAQAPLHLRVDELIAARSVGPVADLADDAEFLRRVSLDLNGIIPSADEVREFLSDPSSEKRRSLVDRLIASAQFPRRMQQVLDVMFMERRPDSAVPAAAWQEYLRRSIADGRPYTEVAAEILRGDGQSPAERPAAKFYLDRGGDPHLLTRDVGRIFFGMDLQCAQCHDHPIIDGYHQADYYGLHAFFNRSFLFTDPAQVTHFAEKGEGEVTFKSVFVAGAEPQETAPHLPGASPIAEPKLEAAVAYLVPGANGARPQPRFSRRQVLAREAASGTSADFNLNLANRLWAMMLGRGLVHPVDFRHPDNPPSHPELLDLLAAELVKTNFDLRAFLGELALSQTYQRSSRLPVGADPERAPPDRFGVAELKPLSPEQLAWSVMQLSGTLGNYRRIARDGLRADPRLADLFEADERRRKLEDELVEQKVYADLNGNAQPFIALFAGAPGQSPADFQATVHQALFLANGEQVRAWLAPSGGNLTEQVALSADAHQAAETLYLSVLSRRPDREEELVVAEYLAGRDSDRPAAAQELVWALLASGEFRFNH